MKRLILFTLLILAAGSLRAEGEMQEIRVREGQTLWAIAREYLQDPGRWPEIMKYNNLPMSDPNAALPGMKIKVPVVLIKEKLRKADLVYILNEVLYRRREQPNWKNAARNLDIYNEDGIRTMDEAEAHVKFFSGDMLRIAQKSLVILRPELKREEVNLMSGVVRTGRTRVITPTVEVNPKTADTVYKARVRKDLSTIVQVERGSTEVLGIDTGKSVVVSEGFANVTLLKTPPSVPVKVPAMPGYDMVDFGPRGEVITEQPRTRTVRKTEALDAPEMGRLSGSTGARKEEKQPRNSYRVQLSLSRQFSRPVLDRTRPLTDSIDVASERDYKVADGKYYRRVSYTDDKGVSSEFYDLPMIEIDTVAPRLEVIRPESGTSSRQNLVNVEGKVDAGAIVTVNGHPVEVKPDGSFRWPHVLNHAGENKIRIAAKDLHDNQTVVERIVEWTGATE